MTKFLDYPAIEKLKSLAEHPLDLTKITSKRIEGMSAQALGLKLFYGTERITEEVLEALFELAEQSGAVKKIHAMQAGEVLNFIEGFESENRSVLHTAMRDFFDGRESAPVAKHATDLAYEELKKLKEFLSAYDHRFTEIVQIGIGGSDLGPRAVYLALEAYQKPGRRAHFISNVDPDDAARVLSVVDLSKTLFVVVSKSGTTLETRTNEEFVREHLRKAGFDPTEHIIAVTGKGSPMDNPSDYLGAFYIWDYVGGRYSVTSMVGGVLLAFTLGMERFLEFLRGAHAMDKHAKESDPAKNLPLLSALIGIWNRNFLHYPTCAVLPYSQAMSRFSAHLQQLDMESNGKSIDRQGVRVHYETGPIVWGEPGTNGQHSFYQLLHQGTDIVPMEFIGFCENQRSDDLRFEGTTCQQKLLANLFAQSIAFAVGQQNPNTNKTFLGNRPNRLLLARKLDPYTMGAILAYYEHKVAFQGFIWNINSFDQEGVQLGKKLAKTILDQFVSKDEKAFPLSTAYLRELKHFLGQ